MNPTQDQLDAIQELVTVGVGRAAASLSDMVQQRVELTVPKLRQIVAGDLSILPAADGSTYSVVEQGFSGKLVGSAMLIIPEKSAADLVNLLTCGQLPPDEMAAEQAAMLTEAGNILINGVVGSLANQVGTSVDFELPSYRACPSAELRKMFDEQGGELILIEVHFTIASNAISGSMGLVFEVDAMEFLVTTVQKMLDGE